MKLIHLYLEVAETPYDEGFAANKSGISLDKNPYLFDKGKRDEWHSGWIDALTSP